MKRRRTTEEARFASQEPFQLRFSRPFAPTNELLEIGLTFEEAGVVTSVGSCWGRNGSSRPGGVAILGDFDRSNEGGGRRRDVDLSTCVCFASLSVCLPATYVVRF